MSGFTSSLGTMRLKMFVAETVVTDSRVDECILIIHQGIYKPYEERLLLSTFQTHFSGIIVENIPTQHNERLRFSLIFEREYLEHTLIPFIRSGVSAGFNIRTPTDEDRELLPHYEAKRKLPWDLSSATRAGNEKSAQSKSTSDRSNP